MLKYQLLVLGPARTRLVDDLSAELEARVEDLGLDAASDLAILRSGSSDDVDWDATPVAVWFGGTEAPDPLDVELLGTLLEEGAPVFPVVEDLARYRDLVPEPCTGSTGRSGTRAGSSPRSWLPSG